jgi:CheY-like chemotaxis protein
MSRVLIVDDEADIRLTLRLILELAGHEIFEAADGRGALCMARQQPDIVLLDIRLPDIDGLEVLRILKNEPEVAGIPVVCVSAHSSEDTLRQALALGAVAYLNKPFDYAHLREVVAAVATSDSRERAG